MESNALMHYGVLGMKWGVRRYRNSDGSLTPAGKKRQEKQDAKWEKRNPEKANQAKKLRSDVIESKTKSLETYNKLLKDDTAARDKAISKIDFNAEAKKRLREELSYLNDGYKSGYVGKKPTERDAIDSFYAGIGLKAPKNASIKDVASIIKADTIVLKKNDVYSKLIENDKKNIAAGESIIKSVSEMPLKEIYDNRNDMHYDYWKKRGYYD